MKNQINAFIVYCTYTFLLTILLLNLDKYDLEHKNYRILKTCQIKVEILNYNSRFCNNMTNNTLFYCSK